MRKLCKKRLFIRNKSSASALDEKTTPNEKSEGSFMCYKATTKRLINWQQQFVQ